MESFPRLLVTQQNSTFFENFQDYTCISQNCNPVQFNGILRRGGVGGSKIHTSPPFHSKKKCIRNCNVLDVYTPDFVVFFQS